VSLHYAFNGDADGLCALQQLRLADPAPATLVTGVKRDIELLRRVDASAGDTVVALDVSLDRNRADLERLLRGGARVRYFDHHFAGDVPAHPRFEPHIDVSDEVWTSLLVDRHLGGRYRAWAIVAAFGDGLPAIGRAMAAASGRDADATATMERIGVGLNYNAYGDAVTDLHFDPADLAEQMLPFADPTDFARASPAYPRLQAGYEDDMRKARAVAPVLVANGARTYVLPNAAWARRSTGSLANEFARAHPDCALAILTPKAGGGFVASVRVPSSGPMPADEFCRGFETGGGRKLAAGVNHIADADVDRFTGAFQATYST